MDDLVNNSNQPRRPIGRESLVSITLDKFLGRLARHANAVLAASKDNNVRFLWIDDIVSPTMSPVTGEASLVTTAHVSENGGRSFVCYRVTLQFSETFVTARHEGD
jgi:hypothetical protein